MHNRPIYTQDSSSEPLISFIIPYYNVPVAMLLECLDSIFALSLSDAEREVILVDDGSDISPINDITKYLDKIIYIRQRNQGPSTARNTGLKMAKGKYIQFVDSDDKLLSSVYEHCLDMIRYHNSDMVLFEVSSKGRQKASNDDFLYDGPVTGAEYMRHNNLHAGVWGYIFRRKLLGELQFHDGITNAEDEEFTPQLMLRAERIFVTKAKAYYYRRRPGSLTNGKGSRWKVNRLNNTIEVLTVLRDRADVLPYDERTAMQRRIDQLTVDYLYNVIVLTHDGHYLERCVEKLKKKGLFPIPVRNYGWKYKSLCRMLNSKVGRKVLLTALKAKR